MILDLVVLLAGAALILNPRTLHVTIAYVLLAAMATASVARAAAGSELALGLLIASAFLKLVVAPVGLWLFVRSNPATRDLRPAIPLASRLVVVLMLGVAARAVASLPAFKDTAMIDVATFVLLSALGMLVVQRNLLAHILGLLALSAGITLAGAAMAPTLPESVELGASFDVLVVTFIGLALVRAFLAHNPLLDVESLRSLRG